MTSHRAKDLAAVLSRNVTLRGLMIPGNYLAPGAIEAICTAAKVGIGMLPAGLSVAPPLPVLHFGVSRHSQDVVGEGEGTIFVAVKALVHPQQLTIAWLAIGFMSFEQQCRHV